jgi:hypothetical protein
MFLEHGEALRSNQNCTAAILIALRDLKLENRAQKRDEKLDPRAPGRS